MKQRLLTLFLLVTLFISTLHSTPHATQIKKLSVKSLEQQVIDADRVSFRGEVEVWVDEKLHLWADIVDVDKKAQTLHARAQPGSFLKIENNDFIILAEQFYLSLLDKTGYAEKVRFHVDEGYLAADRAEKYGENEWRMIDMVYTPCDAYHAHWNLSADSAEVRGGYFIKACNIVFKIGGVPVFYLPRMVFPIQGRSKSGFLIPRFYFDYVYGFGFKQEYYKYFGPHCDTTLAVDWRDKRGLVLSDEFRWACAPENFLHFKGHYAIARDSFVLKKDKIFKATDHRYWIQATDFRSSVLNNMLFASLTRLDFGTDKKIGYHFFNTTDDVDDQFYNSGHLRLFSPKNLVELSIADDKTIRRRFSPLVPDQLEYFSGKQPMGVEVTSSTQELEDRVGLTYLPRFEWNSAYTIWGNIFSYRHDFFVDQVTYRQYEYEKIFLNGVLAQENTLIPQTKADLLRAHYRADFRESFSLYDNTLSLWINPHFQFRSNLKKDLQHSKNVFERRVLGYGGFRFFLTYGAEWALPEASVMREDGSYTHFLQPLIRWELSPKFKQDHWYYFDRWDRQYPANQLVFVLRNSVITPQLALDWQLSQSYDFYGRSDIFFLRRGTLDKHLLPLSFDCSLSFNPLTIAATQEYEWRNGRLLQSEISVSCALKKMIISAGYLFQRNELQTERALLSNIPHFLTFSATIPLTEQTKLCYDAQFYAENRPHFFGFSTIRPLLHRVRLDYNGHCWGFYCGFEEKKYRESGNWKRECAIVLSVRLDSLGSFAQKFRQPQMMRMNSDRL